MLFKGDILKSVQIQIEKQLEKGDYYACALMYTTLHYLTA